MSKVKRQSNSDAAGQSCSYAAAEPRNWETQVDASCYVMENFRMQAGIALGNIASVLSVPSEEAGIVAELKAGSEEAFAWLIAKYHQPIYSLIARTIPDSADAADLTQDVFIKIYRGMAGSTGIPACAPGSTASRYARPATSAAGGGATNARKSP